MKNLILLLVVLSATGSSVVGQIPPNNLGQTVEVATPAGILPQAHLLIGWDSMGYVRQSSSENTFRIFSRYPNHTNLNPVQGTYAINNQQLFAAPSGSDSYEIHFGDSCEYWNGTSAYPRKAANQLPFSAYRVGARPAASHDTSRGEKLCVRVRSNSLYVPGDEIEVYGDLAWPMDSTYWDMRTHDTLPFVVTRMYAKYFRTGLMSVPYTQTTFNPATDGTLPPAGTVIRLVAQTADTSLPIVIAPDPMNFIQVTDSLLVRSYSFMPVTWSLSGAPPNMTIDTAGVVRWPFERWQWGVHDTVVIAAQNIVGTSYRSTPVSAGQNYPALGCDSLENIIPMADNNLLFFTGGDGTIAANPYQSGLRFKYPMETDLIYAGGFYVGTKKRGQGAPDTVTVSDVQFNTEFQPGRILNSGDLGSLITQDSDDSTLGVYLLPDHQSCWPAEAPHDELGNPLKLSLRDSWTVINDMSYLTNPPGLFEEAPMLGLEIQRQTFMFSVYPWNNAVLVRMRIINKSDRTYDLTYFGMWQDPDVGFNSTSDLAAVDSALSLLLVHNAVGADPYPVASGTLLLQGPLDLGSPADTSRSVDIGPDGFTVLHCAQRIMRRATSAIAFRGDVDPTGVEEDITRYHYLRGLDMNGNPKPGGPFDLELGSYPGDCRTIMGSGPFTFTAGDTQTIWYAYVGAVGANDSAAVDTLKHYAVLMHQQFQGDMNDIVVGIGNPNTNAVHDLHLYSNYPNPFNPSTTIKYVLPKHAKVSLKVYNILGQEVRTLVNSRQGIGEHSVIWDGKNKLGRAVSSGVYLYRLEVDGKVKVQKMMVLK